MKISYIFFFFLPKLYWFETNNQVLSLSTIFIATNTITLSIISSMFL